MLEEPPILTIRENFPRPSKEQIAAFKGASTGFICDALGGQAALDSRIRPLGGGRDMECYAIGVALVADNGPQEILATMGAIHIARPGDIVVAATGRARNCAAAGDRFCGMLRNKGVVGLVTDGQVRDYVGIVEAGLPVWCDGLSPNSPYSNGPGRVGFGAVVGDRRIESGDLIIADRDGVAVVPFSKIDSVAGQLARVSEMEAALEAKIAEGYSDMPVVAEMIHDGRAVVVEG